jgi:hypothetical protein
MREIGRMRWAIPGGHVPLSGTGREPEFTSRDTHCVLNSSDRGALVEVTISHADRDPVGPYRLAVAARRVYFAPRRPFLPDAVPAARSLTKDDADEFASGILPPEPRVPDGAAEP